MGAVAVVLEDAAFEDVVVMRVVGATAVGRGDADELAQAIDEALRVGKLRSACVPPLRNKTLDVRKIPHACEKSTGSLRWQQAQAQSRNDISHWGSEAALGDCPGERGAIGLVCF